MFYDRILMSQSLTGSCLLVILIWRPGERTQLNTRYSLMWPPVNFLFYFILFFYRRGAFASESRRQRHYYQSLETIDFYRKHSKFLIK